ncbi:unnamed protein product [Prorocentrum cordatum]|uniref:Uncharacterized protein n=1 Tax=Prorocentrum cordatum TaxID=2364126 RepID=A0ABN9SER7_9DINO|nr:unnamed protein product [Polarella glacialis]
MSQSTPLSSHQGAGGRQNPRTPRSAPLNGAIERRESTSTPPGIVRSGLAVRWARCFSFGPSDCLARRGGIVIKQEGGRRFTSRCRSAASDITTIGVDFRFKTIPVDKKTIKLQIWDTAGQERFRTITSAYYRGADGIVLIYDVTDRETFAHVDEWLAEVDRYVTDSTVKILIGNKCDLAEERQVAAEDRGKKKAEALGMCFLETSAKAATNVQERPSRRRPPRSSPGARRRARAPRGARSAPGAPACCSRRSRAAPRRPAARAAASPP